MTMLRVQMTKSVRIGPMEVRAIAEREMLAAALEAAELLQHRWEEKAGRQTAYSGAAPASNGKVASWVDGDFVLRLLETGRGVVRPKRKKALRFKDGSFAMRAGPVPPKHYLRDAKREVAAAQTAIFAAARERIRAAVGAAMRT